MGNYKPDHAGIGRMLCSEEMQAHLRLRAEAVKTAAEAIAPVYEQGPHPGRYKAAFSVEVGIKESSKATRRAVAKVVNDAPEARWVEYGTENNPKHRTLGKSLGAARL
jgi:hypothetical protein